MQFLQTLHVRSSLVNKKIILSISSSSCLRSVLRCRKRRLSALVKTQFNGPEARGLMATHDTRVILEGVLPTQLERIKPKRRYRFEPKERLPQIRPGWTINLNNRMSTSASRADRCANGVQKVTSRFL
jgi:hypothetical protein